MKVAIKEIMERVGHANYETTMLYTHSQGISQNQTVKAFDNFIDRSYNVNSQYMVGEAMNDITIEDRKKDIYPNNVTLCKENCKYKGINIVY